MKVKSFRINPEKNKELKYRSKQLGLPQCWIINEAIGKYLSELTRLNPQLPNPS